MEILICKDCGSMQDIKEENAGHYKLIVKQLCVECNFWQDMILLADHHNSVRIEGHQYFIGDPEVKAPRLHQKGDHKIQFFNGSFKITNNLFFNGTIPGRYRAQLPDNASFVYERAA